MDYNILEIDNVLPKEICDAIIDRYKKDNRKEKGKIGNEGKIHETIRKSHILSFSKLDDWKDVDNIICDVISRGYTKYIEHIKKLAKGDENLLEAINKRFSNIEDEGYFVQEYKKGDFYSWHIDDFNGKGPKRTLSFVLYLNTLDENDGGSTDFIGGIRIKPVQGKLLIFPSNSVFIHRSEPIKADVIKYTIGTWAV